MDGIAVPARHRGRAAHREGELLTVGAAREELPPGHSRNSIPHNTGSHSVRCDSALGIPYVGTALRLSEHPSRCDILPSRSVGSVCGRFPRVGPVTWQACRGTIVIIGQRTPCGSSGAALRARSLQTLTCAMKPAGPSVRILRRLKYDDGRADRETHGVTFPTYPASGAVAQCAAEGGEKR